MSDSEDYRLLRQLGAGLAGPVFLSETGTVQVAVRQFKSQAPPGSLAWTDERQHFLAAARRASALKQSRIVELREVIDEDGEAFVAMEYVPSETLDPVLKRGDLLPEHANHLLRRMALTLDYVHQKGLTHGDLKPSNVFALPERGVKISDFAISPRARTDNGPLPAAWAHPYISPEHFSAPENIGPRSDRYSLAAIAYHLYTGRPPFDDWGDDLRAAILSGDMLPASSVQKRLSPRVDTVFKKALARDPQLRYASSMEFVDALEASLGSPDVPIPVPVPVKGRSSKALYLLAGLFAAGLLGAALLVSSAKKQPSKPQVPTQEATLAPINEAARAIADPKPPTPPKSARAIVPQQPPVPTERIKPSPVGAPLPPKIASVGNAADRQYPVRPDPVQIDPVRPGPVPSSVAQTLDLAVFSRSRKLENGVGFPLSDPTLGELAHGDLKALVQATGQPPKGKLSVEWLVDGVRMDAKFVTPNRPVEYGNEPTAGTYRVTLRLDSKEVKTFVFRITP